MRGPKTDKERVPAILDAWRRFQNVTAPESAWIAELRREASANGIQERTLLAQLSNRNTHLRQQARRDFLALPAATRRLITVYAYQAALEQISNVVGFTVAVCLAGLAITGLLNPNLIAVVFLFIIPVVIFAHVTVRSTRQQELMLDLLDASNDPRLIPFLLMRLAAALNANQAPRQIPGGRNMRNALVRLLPLVQEEDAAEWTGTHWRFLLAVLKRPYDDIELTLATLDVCARVGTPGARTAIQELTSLQPGFFSSELVTPMRRAVVREASAANRRLIEERVRLCLPLLEARLEKQRQAMTLLRPSDQASATASDMLLRPSLANTSETPQEQLLRPHSGE